MWSWVRKYHFFVLFCANLDGNWVLSVRLTTFVVMRPRVLQRGVEARCMWQGDSHSPSEK